MELPLPAMIIGIGGAGARIARMMADASALNAVLISSSAGDLVERAGGGGVMVVDGDDRERSESYSGKARIDSILLNTGMLNPSPYTIRGSLLRSQDTIRSKLLGYSTFIMVANLAGRNGVAVAPLLAEMIRTHTRARLVTFAIMPFGFESDRLFRAGVALKRLSRMSDCMIVLDNDSFLSNNPALKVKECYRLVDRLLLEVFRVMMSSDLKGLNLLSAGIYSDEDGIDAAVKDAVRMLYTSTEPDKVKDALLYLISGSGQSIGLIDSLVRRIRSMLGIHCKHVMVCDVDSVHEAGCDDSTVQAKVDPATLADVTRVKAHVYSNTHSAVLLSEVTSISKFDSYDPLSMLPSESVLDWECSESEIRLNIETLSAIPDLE